MDIASQTTLQIIQMLVILSIGAYAYKKEIIPDSSLKSLTGILLEIVNPLLIFTSYQREYNKQVKGLHLPLSCLYSVIAILVSRIAVKKQTKRLLSRRMAIMYSIGFIGLPLMILYLDK